MASPVVYTNAAKAQLSENISAADTVVTIGDTSTFTSSGYIAINRAGIDEVIQYAAIDQNMLTGCTRGAESTVAVEHFIGEVVAQVELIIGTETPTTMGALINSASNATPNNSDFVATAESGGLLKKISWTNVKAFLKTYFDTLYVTIGSLFYQTVEDEGTPVTQRSTMNFVGSGVSVADSGGKTVVTVTSGGVADADYGDITVSGGGTVWNIDSGVVGETELAVDAVVTTRIKDSNVTFAKIQAVSADILLGNDAAGTVVEEISCTAAGRAILDDADASAQRTTLGLGTIATQNANAVNITGGTVIADSDGLRTKDTGGSGFTMKIRNVDTLTADRRLNITMNDAARTMTFSGDLTVAANATISNTNTGDQTTIVGITGTKAQFDTAVTDGNILYVGDAPTVHAASHKLGGSDVILLNEFGNPTASVEFNQQQALQFRLENRTSDPGSPAVGECWLRTDL